MSQALSSVAREEFDSEVKHAYQGMMTLRDTVTVRNNVVGGVYKFRKMGKGVATLRGGSSADVVPMNVGHNLVSAVLNDYEAAEYTDIYDKATVNFDEVVELANTVAYAMGRRDDQSIIDSLNTTTISVGAGTQKLDLATITAAAKELNRRGVKMKDRYFVVDAGGLDDILNDEKITNQDYNAVRLLMTGEIDSFMGFKWRLIEDRSGDEGGLPLNTTVRSGFAYHKESVGHAVGIDMQTRIDYVPHKSSWLTNGLWKAGTVLRDVEGVVRVDYLNSIV